jgi:hypothetical protein
VIQELHRACVEREAVINQLAAEATTADGGTAQALDRARPSFREKLWRPARPLALPEGRRGLLDADRRPPAVRTAADRLGPRLPKARVRGPDPCRRSAS